MRYMNRNIRAAKDLFVIKTTGGNVVSVIFFLSSFLFSLGSYYFYGLGLYLFQTLGVLLILPFVKLRIFAVKNGRLLLLMLFFWYAFIVGSVGAAMSGSDNYSLSRMALPVFMLMWFTFAATSFRLYPITFHRALQKVIWVHVIFFIFQFTWFVTTSQFVDFLEPITGESQRALGGSYSLTLLPSFIRATGLYNEPGTYSTWVMILFLLFKSNAQRMGLANKHFYLDVAVLITVLLSFSTFGVVFCAVYLLSVTVEKRFSLLPIMYLILAGMLFAYFGIEYFQDRFSDLDNAGLGFRTQAIELYLSQLTAGKLFFGLGIFNDYFKNVNGGLVYQDVGLWFVILVSTGVIGTVSLALFLWFSVPRNSISFALVIVLMLSKLALTNALVWVVLCYFLWPNPKKITNYMGSHFAPKFSR